MSRITEVQQTISEPGGRLEIRVNVPNDKMPAVGAFTGNGTRVFEGSVSQLVAELLLAKRARELKESL